MSNHSPARHRARNLAAGAAAGVAIVALPAAAQAHVTVQPATTDGGGFTAVAFRVPNERDDASTIKVQVSMPAGQPIGSVQTRPMAGWKVTTQTRHLAKPIDFFGEKLDTVVPKITWTSTDGGLKSGTYDDFNVSLGPLPKSGTMTFNAVQTYSTGEVVKWNEVAADPTVEPEHPAPSLELTAPVAEGSGATDASDDTIASAESSSQAPDQAATTGESDSSSSAWGIVLGGIAVVISLVAAALSWRRRPTAPATTESQRPLDHAGV